MIPINEASVIEQFNELVPRAAALAETYLRAVAKRVQEYEPPVTMAIDFLTTGGFRAQKVQCLVVEPTDPRLRAYKTAHYANPSGGSLSIGWYLVGGEKAMGRQIGGFTFGSASDLDVDQVIAIVQTVHTYAVLPSIQELADIAQLGGPQQPGGFFGV